MTQRLGSSECVAPRLHTVLAESMMSLSTRRWKVIFGSAIMRVAVGGILHETSTFLPARTTAADFEHGFGVFRGDAMLARFRGANMCVGGFLAAADEERMTLVPLLWGFAYPSGVIRRLDYEELKRELLDR